MKKFALICMFAALVFGVSAQEVETKEVPANGAKIRFEQMEHQYGTIQKGGNGDCQFTFWNDGNEPLILQNVKASCGCTTPKYTQKPVMPGESGVIDVHYNTNNVGGFSKTVTVTSNAVDNPRVVLRIKGNVKQDVASEEKPEMKSEEKKPAKNEPAELKPQPKVKPVLKTAEEKAAPAKVEKK